MFRVVLFQRCTEAVDSSGIRLFRSHSANLARGSQVSSLAPGSWLLALSSLARPLTKKEAVAGIRVRRRRVVVAIRLLGPWDNPERITAAK